MKALCRLEALGRKNYYGPNGVGCGNASAPYHRIPPECLELLREPSHR